VSSVAVIFVDLDDFKKVNDSLGHAAGDELLTVVGERLLNATRGSDTVARLGGDEFAILVENARTDDDVLTVADRVVRAMRAPVMVDGREIFVGASVGVARAATVREGGLLLDAGQRAEELLRNADVAMYRAKGAGKGRHVLYEQGMLDDALERLEMEGELRHAVERGELRVHYQPIVELDGERVTAVEALVRWQHPRLGLVPPARFLSLAEETGLIVPLGRWVLEEACRQVTEWRRRALVQGDADGAPLTVAVNVSGRQIRDLSFVADVRDALVRSALPPDALLLELPERVFMQCTDAELERLRALKTLGVRLGIDDFGTGYASLSYLQKFPVDVLKIDRSFVEGVTRGGSDAALARAVIALSDMLSVRTVAEGVARPQQQEQLRALGCALGQGFLFAQPLAAEDMDAVLGLRVAERAA
jgi:diguanylate cyclase (GGDEF)-like protein